MILPLVVLSGLTFASGCASERPRDIQTYNENFNRLKIGMTTAREMIRMVRSINHANFKGEAQVSCYTCHMGQPVPQRFPALPVAMASPIPTTQASESTLPDSPSGKAVIDHYMTAIGGEEALRRISSCIMAGRFVSASGATGTYEIEQVPPDKGYESIMTSRGGRERGVIDTTGWEKTSFGASDLLPEQVPDMQLSLPLLMDIQLQRQYSEVEVSGKEKINQRDAYVVDATRKDGRRERLYFDMMTVFCSGAPVTRRP
jgi:hypothetical protein